MTEENIPAPDGLPSLEELLKGGYKTPLTDHALNTFLRLLCYYPDPYLVCDALLIDRWEFDEFVNGDTPEAEAFKEKVVRAEAIGKQSFAAKAIFQALNGEEEYVVSGGKIVEYFDHDTGTRARLKRKRINADMLKLFLISSRPDLKDAGSIDVNMNVGVVRIPQFLDTNTLTDALANHAEKILALAGPSKSEVVEHEG